MPTPAPPQVASQRSSFLPRVNPRTAISANRTSEQVLRIFGGQMGWLVRMAIRAITAAASPATPMYPCGRNRASTENTTRGKKAKMSVSVFIPGTLKFPGRRDVSQMADLGPGGARDLDPGAQPGLLQDVRDVGLHRPR